MNNNEFEKCEFYDKGITFNGDIRPSGYCLINYLLTQAGYKCPTIYCSDIRNCLYKQNLKLQEENRRLKEGWDMCGQEEQEIIAELKAENKRLKKKINTCNAELKSVIEIRDFQSNVIERLCKEK